MSAPFGEAAAAARRLSAAEPVATPRSDEVAQTSEAASATVSR